MTGVCCCSQLTKDSTVVVRTSTVSVLLGMPCFFFRSRNSIGTIRCPNSSLILVGVHFRTPHLSVNPVRTIGTGFFWRSRRVKIEARLLGGSVDYRYVACLIYAFICVPAAVASNIYSNNCPCLHVCISRELCVSFVYVAFFAFDCGLCLYTRM